MEEPCGSVSRKRRKISPQEDDIEYFSGYEHIGIHEEMIRDEARTGTYREAMMKNPSDFKDKVVLDVGCGSGILSFFAIQAGAKKVYGVDASNIIDEAQKVVTHNQMSEKIILIKGKVEEIQIPEMVDIIISEWMGYFLLYESMLESVFFARDKWLKKDGKMFPTEANLYLVPFEDEQFYSDRVNFWNELYGIDFSPIIPYTKKCVFSEGHVENLSPLNEISFSQKIFTIHCNTMNYEHVRNFSAKFSMKAIMTAEVHGIAGFFDVVFKGTDTTLKLSTAPSAPGTHWRQTLFFFDEPVPVTQDVVTEGTITITPHEESNRAILVTLSCCINGKLIEKIFHLK